MTFGPGAEFHRSRLDDPKTNQLVREAVFEVTGRRLAILSAVGTEAHGHDEHGQEPLDEEGFISLLQEEFNATEIEETPVKLDMNAL